MPVTPFWGFWLLQIQGFCSEGAPRHGSSSPRSQCMGLWGSSPCSTLLCRLIPQVCPERASQRKAPSGIIFSPPEALTERPHDTVGSPLPGELHEQPGEERGTVLPGGKRIPVIPEELQIPSALGLCFLPSPPSARG